METISKENQIKASFYEKIPSRNLVFTTFIVILGSSFYIGYNGAILNYSHDKLSKKLADTLRKGGSEKLAESVIMIKIMWAFLTSVYFLGGALGAVISVSVTDKYDPSKVIFTSCGLTILAVFIKAVAIFTEMVYPIIIARYVSGITSGIFSCTVPLYLTEIAPVATRGMVCSCFSIFQAAGILAAYVCMNTTHEGDIYRIFVCILPAVPIIIQLIFMRHCRPSPRFLLIKKQDDEEALKSLQWFRRTEDLHLLDQELDEMSKELQDAMSYASQLVQWRHLFRMRYMRKPMLVSMLLMCAQQLSGVNMFLLYSTTLFEEAGVPLYFCHAGTITIGAVLLIMSIVSMLLVEITGRRMLMLYGYAGTFIFSLMHYLTYMYNETLEGPLECVGAVAGLFIWFFIVHYALGPNSVPWVLIPEIFNQAFRPKAVAVASCCYWMTNSLTALFWPLTEVIGPHLFLISLCFQVIFFFLLYKYVPETSNKTITEITEMYTLGR